MQMSGLWRLKSSTSCSTLSASTQSVEMFFAPILLASASHLAIVREAITIFKHFGMLRAFVGNYRSDAACADDQCFSH